MVEYEVVALVEGFAFTILTILIENVLNLSLSSSSVI